MANKPIEIDDLFVDELAGAPKTADPAADRQARARHIANLRLLWTERRSLTRVVGLGAILSALVAFLIPAQYTSTARLMPPDQATGSGMAMLASLAGKAGDSLGTLGGALLGLKTSGDLFVGILQSRTVEEDLVRRFDLRKVYGERSWEDASVKLASRTNVVVDRKNEIISIQVTDKSPERAAAIAQEYVAELNRVVTDLNTTSAHRERVFLEGRLVQVKQDLESAEQDFSVFASKNTAIDIQEQGKAMIAAGANLEGQLIAAQTELEGLRQVFTNNNVRVRETQARVDELRRQLVKLGGKAGASSTADGQEAGTLYPSIRQLPLLGVAYADLYRRTKVQEAVFETLTQECELAKVEEAKETPSVRVLDPANVPEHKTFPPRLLITVGGTLFAGVLATAWVLGNACWEEIDPQEPGKVFASEVVNAMKGQFLSASGNGHGATVGHQNFWPHLRKRQDSAKTNQGVSSPEA